MATDVVAPARATTWQQVKALAASPMAPFYFIAASVAVLTGLGLLMVLSASSVIALDRGVGPFYYLGKQAGALAVGLVGAVALAVLPPEALRRMGWLAWVVAVLLLGLVLTPLGTDVGGNQNWLRLG
ncbi:MAG: FtsW/RodA/SpoVE family cell cycle protein, partial [Propionibacteriaceae bacterium]|nr:FtsW/RodA/SpoVE family cell cycle protein [Propionibacteriaceae bacterium]